MVIKLTVSGLRGIWNNGLDLNIISSYTKRYVKYLDTIKPTSKTVLLSRDTRKTSPLIYDYVSSILRAYGYSVLGCDVVTTPMSLFLVRKLRLAGGIIVTASHNTPEWNGLKFVDENGKFLSQEAVEFLFNTDENLEVKNWNEVGDISNLTEDEILNIFTLELEKTIEIHEIRKRSFKIGFDPVNGAGSSIGIKFLKFLGCKVYPIHYDTSKFPERNTEPNPEALKKLSELVKENHLDLGFALDPDGDRLVLVNDQGIPISEEFTLPLAEMSAIENCFEKLSHKYTKTIVINLSSSLLSEHIAKKYGFEVVYSKVGEANVVKTIEEKKSFIGGEGNGGVIFPEVNSARDSFVGMTLILLLLAKANKRLSEIIYGIPSLTMKKEKFTQTLDNTFAQKLDGFLSRKGFSKLKEHNIDGVRLDFDKGWVHIRPSNTEQITRVIFEGNENFINCVRDFITQHSK